MDRRLLILALAAVASPALSAEKEGEKVKPAGDNNVDIATVGLPVIMDGRLVNYVFASVRLILAPGANQSALRAKEPYYRDALVKAAHRTPFTVANNPNVIDEAALRRVLLPEVQRIGGPKSFSSILVLSQQPKNRVRNPG
jgi:hypothetical protein